MAGQRYTILDVPYTSLLFGHMVKAGADKSWLFRAGWEIPPN